MILPRKPKASVTLCVLVLWSGVGATSGPCTLNVDVHDVTVNCKSQNLNSTVDWTELVSQIDKDAHVRITFFNNSITNITQLPSVPGSQVALTFLRNKVAEIVPSAFSKIPRLTSLDLSNNSLTGEVLRSEIFQGPYYDGGMYGNIALEKLYLSYNEIHSFDRFLFQYTPNLTTLFLDHNPIEILDTVTMLALSSAVNLKYLDLSFTGIESIQDDVFRNLLQLEHLDLSGNRFVTVPGGLNYVGKTLKMLIFNYNPIMELNDESFIGLSSLQELEIAYNDNLDEVKRSTFSPLKSLNLLHLCHNRNLRYISHLAFRGMKDTWTINEVYLDDNYLSELSLDLMPWSKVQVLGMTGNNWLCNCDLANIVITLGAGKKFKENEIPLCASPMRLHGEYLTNITDRLNYCPTFDTTFKTKKGFSLADLKPKHVLWSILGVGLIVVVGMLLGLLVNAAKVFYDKNIRSQPILYINLHSDAAFP